MPIQSFDAAKRSRSEFWRIDIEQTEHPEKLNCFKQVLFAWIFSHMLQMKDTPMWTGFNGKISDDKSRIQKIEYLTQINSSPTNPDVVKETMRRSLQIAFELGKQYFLVAYDLAMAKIALRIQSAEEKV